MHRGFDTYFGAPMTQNECYSNIIAPGSTRKGGKFGPCPLFNGSAAVPWRQSTGIYPHDKHAVDMVNVDEAYDADASNVVRRAHRLGKPFFYVCPENVLANLRVFLSLKMDQETFPHP